MGAGIAEVAARAGHRVLLLDAVEGAAASAVEAIGGRLERDVARDRLTTQAAQAVRDQLEPVGATDELAPCGLVVEAVAEDLQVKRDLFAALEEVVADDAVLATNTSSLSVTAVGGRLRRPGRLVGMHFFNPAPRMRLVEVVRGAATDPDVLGSVVDLVRAWGKEPVTCASTPGFIVNRVARPFYGEAQRMVEEGVADPATVDHLLRAAGGFPMGPFELTDLVGQDVNLAVSRSVWEQTFHDPRYAPTVLQQGLVDAGRLGRKSGRGVYRYDADAHQDDGPHAGAVAQPRTVPPSRVRYSEGWAVMEPLLARIADGGVEVAVVKAGDPECTDEIGVLLPSGGRLVETDGSTASSVGRDVVVLDWALDAATTGTVVVAAAPSCSAKTLSEAVGLLQCAGVEVVVVKDAAGLVVARTVSMVVNEAVALVARGEATRADVDTAMTLGTGYPLGPLAWGERLGPSCVTAVLRNLHEAVPTGRYRVAPELRHAAESGSPLDG
jgi:3-hydroxybutyryl-CoA dehydrogenase